MSRKRKAQSVLEYIIILALIITVVAGVMAYMRSNPSEAGLGKLMDKAGQTIEDKSGEIVSLTE
ncbi:hypothetical protein ACFL1K_04300 [Candidatus Omnitrophota bacterium]